MRIDTKFNIGDNVYVLEEVRENKCVKCAFCNGKGEVKGVNGDIAYCPVCSGDGEVYKPVIQRYNLINDEPEAVTAIIVNVGDMDGINTDVNDILYYVGSGPFYEKDLFSTKEEAIKKINDKDIKD